MSFPALPEHHLWIVATDDEKWLHLPCAEAQMELDYHVHNDTTPGHTYRTVCDTTGEVGMYGADEFVLDEDWCDVCKAQVERDRDFIDLFKTIDVADALKDIMTNVPTFIVATTRRKSTSKDRIYEVRP